MIKVPSMPLPISDTRVQVLKQIYDMSGKNPLKKIPIKDVKRDLNIIPEGDVEGWIEYYCQKEFLKKEDNSKNVCITAKGIDYIESTF